MNGITIVPLLFTSITNERNQVFLERPLNAFLYRDVVAESMLRKYAIETWSSPSVVETG